MTTNPKEVTALNSHAALITELTETRRHLWMAISKVKQFVHLLPARERAELLAVVMDAEKHLTH
jgi:hypothetical protein